MRDAQETSGRRTTGFLNSSMVTALAAVIISVSALGVSIYETYLMRIEQHASVMPILEAWSSHNSEGFSIKVANKGIGPALIRGVEVFLDSVPGHSWADIYEGMLDGESPGFNMAMITGNVMSPGDLVPAIEFEPGEAATVLWNGSDRVDMKICYCSVFDDCWVLTLENVQAGTPRNTETQSCDVVETNLF